MTSEPLTDEERIAYWQGAYERMAARNHELAAECKAMSAALEQATEALDDMANGRGLNRPIEQIIRDISSPTPSAGKDRS